MQTPSAIEPADLALLRSLVPLLTGVRLFALSLAGKVAPEPAEPLDETPEEGPALVGADLRCIVVDTIDPAIQRLEALLDSF